MAEWRLSRIPKIVHHFWDDRPMSFMRWMSLHSFSTLNSDWEIRLHTASNSIDPNWFTPNNKQEVKVDYRDRLPEIPNLRILEESEFSTLPGVQRSDILRNKYLVKDGGFWSDIDIIYYRPMTGLSFNLSEHDNADCGLCHTGRWFPIAFMCGASGSEFFRDVYNAQVNLFQTRPNVRRDYQRYGTKVYSNVFRARQYPHIRIPKAEVYPQNWRQHAQALTEPFDLQSGVGIHWYGGSPTANHYEPIIDHQNWRDFPIRKLIEVTL